jgi:hypothetical protein
MFHLHKRWLQTLNCVQDLLFECLVLDNVECLLKNVVAKLVVDQALDDKVHARLQSLCVA